MVYSLVKNAKKEKLNMSEKPRFVQEGEKLLAGDKLANYLDFGDFVKENKASKIATTKPTSHYSRWAVKYKKRMICHFRAYNDYWFISFFKSVDINQYEPFISSEMKAYILTKIAINPGCSSCEGRKDRLILGKHYDAVCGCHLLCFRNPEGEDLERAKELLLITKRVVDAQG